MIFTDNKYTKVYYSIIQNGQTRLKPQCYTEKHHIIPKCLGGDNNKDNLVILTAREHFVCHKLLVKMVYGQAWYKMKEALSYFSNNRHRKLVFNSRDIAMLREANSIAASMRNKGNKNYLFREPASSELKQLRSENASKSRWVNNGITEHFVKNHEELINDGYKYGRLKMPIEKMIIWDDARRKKRSEEERNRPLITCYVCGFKSNAGAIAYYHNDRCKHETSLTDQTG